MTVGLTLALASLPSTPAPGAWRDVRDATWPAIGARFVGGVMPPTPVVLAARARGIWTCDRGLRLQPIAQGVA